MKLDGKITHLVEVKAIGFALKERHLKQALGYASNEGVEWLVLTNGVTWQLYSVLFAKPIDKTLVAELDLLALDPKDDQQIERLYAFSKEGCQKGAHVKLRDLQEALSRHLVAALLLQNRKVLLGLRREVRKVIGIRVEPRELRQVLRSEVIKRDILDDPAYEAALGKVRRGQAEHVPGGKSDAGGTADVPSGRSVTLAQLIEAGFVATPLSLHRRYKGATYEATLRPDAMIEWEGRTYDNPSKVASAVRERVMGRPMATNGWSFWRFQDATGKSVTLHDARKRYGAGSAASAG